MAGFEPEWRGVFENWTKAYMKVHHWKLRHEMDYADAVAEGARIFAWCLRKTTSRGGKINNERWFMRYYQRAVDTWLIDQASRSTHRHETQAALAQSARISPALTAPEGPLYAALAASSTELQGVLRVILATPSEFFLGLLLRPGPDMVWSRRLCRLCGIPVNENIIGELRELLHD